MTGFENIDSINLESPISDNLLNERRIRELEFFDRDYEKTERPDRKQLKDLVSNGEFGVARHLVLEWMKANPQEEYGFENMALIESYEGNTVTGWMWCANLLDKFPKNKIGLCLRKIREKIEMKKYEDANREIEILLKLDENNAFAIISKAIMHSENGELLEASRCWEELISIQKLPMETRLIGLKIIYQAKRFEILQDILIDEIELDGVSLIHKELLIKTQYNLMLSEECILNSEKILEDYPENEIALKLKGRSLLRLGRLAESIKLFNEYCVYHPTSVSAWESLIEAHLRMDKVDEASEIWSNLRDEVNTDIEILFTAIEVSLIFHWMDRCMDLIRDFDDFIRENSLAITKISELYLKVGDIGNSWSFLCKFGIEPMNSELKNELVRIMEITKFDSKSFLDFDGEDSSVWIPELVTKEIMRTGKKRKSVRKKTPKCHLITSSLNRGGAERQVALTMKYISSDERFDCSLVVQSIKNRKGTGTFAEDLSEQSEKIFQLDEINYDISGINKLNEEYADLLGLLNNNTKERILRLIHHFTEHSPDLVHAWQDDTILTTSLAAAITGIPKVIGSARSLRPDKKTSLHIRKRPYLRNCFRVIFEDSVHELSTNSKAGKSSYSEWIGIEKNKIFVIENGVDFEGMERSKLNSDIEEKLTKIGVKKGDFVIGGVFRLEAGKRPELWLEAFKECRNRNNKFKGIIVGGGSMENSLVEWIKESNLRDCVHLIGEIEDVAGWLEIMDIFLFTSSAEGLPNVLIEAQGFSTPVVSTDVGGVGEVVIDGKTGILVDSAEPSKLADAVIQIHETKNLEKMGLEAEKMARERFSVQSMVKKTGEMYSRVISSQVH